MVEKSPYKPDYAVLVNDLNNRYVVLAAEFKPPSGRQRLESDLVKLVKEMRVLLNRLVQLGVHEPVICGIWVGKGHISTYKMDLPSS